MTSTGAVAPRSTADQGVLPEEPVLATWTTLVARALAVWLLVVVPQALRVAGHGPSGTAGAALLLVLGALLSAVVVLEVFPRAALGGSWAVLLLVGVMATGPYVGRVPWTLAACGAVVAAAAAGGPWPGRRVSGSALMVLAVAAVVWVWTGGVLPEVALLALAGLLVLLAHRGSSAVRAVDARLGRAGTLFLGVARRPWGAASTWWRDPGTRAARWAGAAGSLLALPVMWRLTIAESVLVRGTNDYEAHVERALAITFSPLFSSVPHPVWHLLFRVLDPVLGVRATVVVIGMAAAGATVAVLVTIGRSAWDDLPPLGPRLAAAYGLGYLLMENVGQFVPRGDSWWNRLDVAGLRARGPSFWPLHQWGSPTMTLSLPVVLLMVATLLFSLRGDLERARRHRVALAVLTVVATMALPAGTLALVPATVLYLLVTRRWDRERLAVVVPYFLVPGALTCVLQTVFLASGVSVYERTTWRWNPFWNIRYIGFDRPAFWLLFLVLPVAWWLCGRRVLRDPMVLLSLLALVVALFPAFLLQQTEPEKLMDGDLIMPAFFAVVLLVMGTVRLVLVELQSAWMERAQRPVPPAAVAAALLLGLMVCSGVLDLLGAAGVVPEL
jgi:hypothetical protein